MPVNDREPEEKDLALGW